MAEQKKEKESVIRWKPHIYDLSPPQYHRACMQYRYHRKLRELRILSNRVTPLTLCMTIRYFVSSAHQLLAWVFSRRSATVCWNGNSDSFGS